jgi:hypothetical protein
VAAQLLQTNTRSDLGFQHRLSFHGQPRNTASTSTTRSATTTIQIKAYAGVVVVPMGRSQVFREHACAGAILIVVRKTPGSLEAINTRLNSRPRPGGLLPRFEGALKDFHPLAEKWGTRSTRRDDRSSCAY